VKVEMVVGDAIIVGRNDSSEQEMICAMIEFLRASQSDRLTT
jgi:hypothetical protein